jgi:hypothetical protein
MELFIAGVTTAVSTKAKVVTAKVVVGAVKFIVVGGLELIKWSCQ